MKKLFFTAVAICAIGASATPAFAGNDMTMPMHATMPMSSNAALTDAQVKKVDVASGMVTLKHGALDNVGMPPMTMAFKTRDATMVKQIHVGDKVRVRVENVDGTLTIVKLERQS